MTDHKANDAFPAWVVESVDAVETSLGEAYTEPAEDVRGYIAYARSRTG